MGRLQGKTALITGASRGQGEAQARLFASEGANVVLGDIRDELGRAVAAELDDKSAVYVHLDVTDPDQWLRAVTMVVDRFGCLDVLVNNAGGGPMGTIEDLSLEDYHTSIAINQTGPWLGIRAAVPAMREGRGGGSIINISSVAGMVGGSGAYSVAKWAVRGMTKVAALQFAADGIRVNSVHPGIIETRMATALGGPDIREVILREKQFMGMPVPLGRIGEVDDVAQLVLFLASDDSSYCTGAEFVIDGGALAGRPLVRTSQDTSV